jgi:hypothetical protein
MKRILLSTCLVVSAMLNLTAQANAQPPSDNHTGQYYHWYWHHHGQYPQSAEEREWSKNQQLVFPGAEYDYNGWANPGSVYNNPYSPYGAAAAVPTLYYPRYLIGNYCVKVVPYNSPNYYAPRQYDYIPVPRR